VLAEIEERPEVSRPARDTIREACIHGEDAWRATWDPAIDWDEWNQAVWVGFDGAWEAARLRTRASRSG
jgi:hypothetical protein